MLLRGSAYKGAADYPMVLQLAKGAKGADVNGYRAEFIRMVEQSQLLDKRPAVSAHRD
jgi:Ca-activated chloride channel family protein